MFTFGTLTVGEKEYTLEDAKQVVIIKQFGLDDDFYGGRVTHIGITDSDVLLIMSDANTVIDTGAKDLNDIPISLIRKLCDRRKIKTVQSTSKDKMILMLGGKVIGKESE